MVRIQATTIERATPHRTADSPSVDPTPMTVEETTCVVETGAHACREANVSTVAAVRVDREASRRVDLDDPPAEGADDPPAAGVGAQRDRRGGATA